MYRFKLFSVLVFLSLSLLGAPAFASSGEAEESEQHAGEPGWDAFHALQAGNKRFVSQEAQYAPDTKRRLELVAGQKPHTIILSCADSRVPPELIFDLGLGEIFVLRVAGNVLNAETMASIEYALEHLGTRLIVVMGHESCGAVKAALTTPKGQSAGSRDLDTLVAQIQRNLGGNKLFKLEDKTLAAPVRTNVSAVARQLVSRSHIVRELIEKKQLLIAEGMYGLSSGVVNFWYVGQPEIDHHQAHGGSKEQHSAPVRKAAKKSTHQAATLH